MIMLKRAEILEILEFCKKFIKNYITITILYYSYNNEENIGSNKWIKKYNQ